MDPALRNYLERPWRKRLRTTAPAILAGLLLAAFVIVVGFLAERGMWRAADAAALKLYRSLTTPAAGQPYQRKADPI